MTTPETSIPPRSKSLPYLAIICIPILYGSFYITTKIINESIPVFIITAFRMGFAMLGFLPFLKRLRYTNKSSIVYGFILSVIVFGGVIGQTIGLQSIDAGKAGFIGGLFVILTPFFSWLLFRTRIPRLLFIPIIISFIGIFVMFYSPSTQFLSIGLGEALNFVGAFSIALHLVVLGKAITKGEAFCIAFYQMVFMFILSILCAFIFKQSVNFHTLTGQEWILLAYLGIAIGTIPFVLQSWAQQHIADTPAAIIISIEPVFATIFGILFGDEKLTWQIIIGGLLIFVGILITILISSKTPPDQKIEAKNAS